MLKSLIHSEAALSDWYTTDNYQLVPTSVEELPVEYGERRLNEATESHGTYFLKIGNTVIIGYKRTYLDVQ